jgi:hypothetical protein
VLKEMRNDKDSGLRTVFYENNGTVENKIDSKAPTGEGITDDISKAFWARLPESVTSGDFFMPRQTQSHV